MDYTGLPIYTDENGRQFYVLPDGVTLVPVPSLVPENVKFTPPFVPPGRDIPANVIGSESPEAIRLRAEQERQQKTLAIGAVVLIGALALLR